MLELMLCSMLTLLPDFLFRRFVQGKRLGKEVTWKELVTGDVELSNTLSASLAPGGAE